MITNAPIMTTFDRTTLLTFEAMLQAHARQNLVMETKRIRGYPAMQGIKSGIQHHSAGKTATSSKQFTNVLI